MKLTADQIDVVKTKLGAEPLAEDHAAYSQLSQAFGEHSFYVGEPGLLVFEPIEEASDTARLILIAAWADENKSEIGAIEPEATEILVDLTGQTDPMGTPNGTGGDGSAA